MRSANRLIVVSLAVLGAGACGGGGGQGGDPDGGGQAGADAAPLGAEPTGLIEIYEGLVPANGDTGVGLARAGYAWADFVRGGRLPFHHETARIGDCRLLEAEVHDCADTCPDGACTEDGVCHPFPTRLDAGGIDFGGVADAVELQRTDDNWYYSGPLPADLFEPGAEVRADAAGGADLAAFSLAARAPASLAVDGIDSPVPLDDEHDLTLTWEAASGASASLIIYSANRGHGLPYDAIIECEAPDRGEIMVSRSLLPALGELSGMACLVGNECPPATLARFTRGTIEVGDDLVELRVGDRVTFYVSHQGG